MPYRPPKHPFSYPLNRLILRVGMWFRANQAVLPLCETPEAREALEARIRALWPLDWAVEERILAAYRFVWHERGKLMNIKLVPHASQRRVPATDQLQAYWFPD